MRSGPALLAGWIVLAITILLRNGANPWLSPLVVLALVLCVRGATSAAPDSRIHPRALAAGVILSAALGLSRAPGGQLEGPWARPLLGLLTLLLAATAVFAIARPRRAGAALALLLALHLVAGSLLIHASPLPGIDVYFAQREGAAALLAGVDPYATTFTNPYTPDRSAEFLGRAVPVLEHYPYPPATLLVTTLAHAALGDVRFAMLAAQLATCALLFALARRSGRRPDEAIAIAALSLLHPRALFLLEQSWTEPLLGAAWAALLVVLARLPDSARTPSPSTADREHRRALVGAGVALGVFLATKQYAALLLPLLLRDRALGRPLPLLVALATGAVVTLPFLWWDPRAFVDDVLLFQMHQPFRMDALSLSALVALVTGFQPPAWLSFVAAIAAIAWCRRHVPAAAGIAASAAIVLFAFFVVGKQAFANYYSFVGTAILCALATPQSISRAVDDATELTQRVESAAR